MQTLNEDKQQKLLEIKHLKKYFPLQTNLLGKPKAYLRAVDDVSFDLMAGKTIGIVGESGCGKTTLGRTILKLYDLTGGKVIYHGQSIDDFLPKYYYKCIRYLPYYKWRFNRLKKNILKILQENESFSKQNEIINLIKKVDSNSFQFDEIKEIFLEIELDISEQEKSLLKKINKKMVNLMQLLENCAATTGGVILSEEVKSISKELILKLRKEQKLKKLQQLKNEYNSKSKAQSKNYQEKLSNLENQITQVLEIIKASSDNLKVLKNQIQDTELFQYLEGKREKGLDLNRLSTKEMRSLRQEIQLIFQDPYSSLPPRMTVGAIISEAVRVHKIVPKNEINDYVRDIMKKCGLQSQFYDRYPHEFSGGQRQRICIARALAVKPKLVICDEPVSALDVSIQAQIINLLKDLQRELGLTYVFISHDLSVVKYITDDILVMYLGNMMEKGDTKAIFQKPLHPYTQALFSAVPVPNPDEKMNRIILKGDIPSPANPPKGCKFHTRCVHCMSICKLQTPLFTEIEHNHYVACHLYNQNAMANQEFYDKQLEEVQLQEEKPKEEHIASIKKIWNRLVKKKNE